ncbi:5750_t:CDS:2, partial [Cetraspora pellucida]
NSAMIDQLFKNNIFYKDEILNKFNLKNIQESINNLGDTLSIIKFLVSLNQDLNLNNLINNINNVSIIKSSQDSSLNNLIDNIDTIIKTSNNNTEIFIIESLSLNSNLKMIDFSSQHLYISQLLQDLTNQI